MFEYIDEKLGKVKVVNVTEARASMASIMNDKEVSYVITKNNQPIRVIVNYDVLKKSGTLSSASNKSIKTIEVKDPVKGILGSRLKELEKIQKVENPSPVEAKIETPEMSDPELAIPELEYPSLQEQEFFAEMPEPIIQSEEISQSSTENREAVFKEPVEEVPEPPSPVPEISDQEPALRIELNTPPPDDNYFDRYKKLYEKPRYDTLFSAQRETGVRGPFTEVKSSGDPPVTSSPVSTQPEKISTNVAMRAEGELPSIHDLLMDLDDEVLTHDESASHVQQILNRISNNK